MVSNVVCIGRRTACTSSIMVGLEPVNVNVESSAEPTLDKTSVAVEAKDSVPPTSAPSHRMTTRRKTSCDGQESGGPNRSSRKRSRGESIVSETPEELIMPVPTQDDVSGNDISSDDQISNTLRITKIVPGISLF